MRVRLPADLPAKASAQAGVSTQAELSPRPLC